MNVFRLPISFIFSYSLVRYNFSFGMARIANFCWRKRLIKRWQIAFIHFLLPEAVEMITSPTINTNPTASSSNRAILLLCCRFHSGIIFSSSLDILEQNQTDDDAIFVSSILLIHSVYIIKGHGSKYASGEQM